MDKQVANFIPGTVITQKCYGSPRHSPCHTAKVQEKNTVKVIPASVEKHQQATCTLTLAWPMALNHDWVKQGTVLGIPEVCGWNEDDQAQHSNGSCCCLWCPRTPKKGWKPHGPTLWLWHHVAQIIPSNPVPKPRSKSCEPAPFRQSLPGYSLVFEDLNEPRGGTRQKYRFIERFACFLCFQSFKKACEWQGTFRQSRQEPACKACCKHSMNTSDARWRWAPNMHRDSWAKRVQ